MSHGTSDSERLRVAEVRSEILNVSLLPPPRVAQEVSALSEHSGGMFTIDGMSRHAHMTIYMARFPASDRRVVEDQLSSLLAVAEPIPAEHDGYNVTTGSYYEASYRGGKELVAMQREVSQTLAAYRYRPGNPIVEPYFLPGSESLENARQTGYDLDGQLYRPHITITRLLPGVASQRLARSNADLSFVADRVGLFVADGFGAARTPVREFRLPEVDGQDPV